MSSRRQEIEAKKQKLLELRRQREEKEKFANQERASRKSISKVDEILTSLEQRPQKTEEQQQKLKLQQKPDRKYGEIAVQTDIQNIDDTKKDIITYSKSTQTEVYGDEDEVVIIDEQVVNEEATEDNGIANEDSDEQVKIQNEILDDTDVDEEGLSSFLQNSFKILNKVVTNNSALKNYSKLKSTLTRDSLDGVNYSLKDSIKLEKGLVSLDVSPFFPELIIISIGKSILLYDISTKTFDLEIKTFTDIINIDFHKKDASLIIGSGSNGKIFIWDFTKTSKTPLLETSTNYHSFPVWSFVQVNDSNNNQLILTSSSTDGKIISWDTEKLNKPFMEPLILKPPKSLMLRYDELTPLVIAELKNEYGFSLIGSEDGNIYKFNKFGKDDNQIVQIFQKHEGPITAIEGNEQFSDLFLSSSLDWKVYLWDNKNPEKPLAEIYKSDSILDCHWRRLHPTQFGFIYENFFELIDLDVDSITPVVKYEATDVLNKFKFDAKGENVILGTIKGDVIVLKLEIPELDESEKIYSRFKKLFIKK